MKKYFIFLFLFLCALSFTVRAQITSSGGGNTGFLGRFSDAQIPNCTLVGQLYYNTTSNKHKVCTAVGTPGTWTDLAGGAGGTLTDGDKGDITVASAGASFTVDANAILNTKIRQSAGLSVIGRSANTTGDVADITAAADGDILRRSGTSIGFGKIPTTSITAGADDTVDVSDGTTRTAKTLPSCSNAVTSKLLYDAATNTFSCGTDQSGSGGGTPGGSTTQLQYNNAGTFAGISGATSDGTNVTFGSGNLRATKPRITTSIDDANGNEVIITPATASAVNEVTVTNAATGNAPDIAASGSDTNIDLKLTPKGTGAVRIAGSGAGAISLTEGTAPAAAAANNVQIYAPADVTTAYDVVLPAASATGFVLGTNSSNVNTLSFVGSTGSGNVVRATAPTIDAPVITTKVNFPSVTAFPGSPATGDVVVVTDDSGIGACDSAAGSARSLCRYNGASWVSLGDGGSGSSQAAIQFKEEGSNIGTSGAVTSIDCVGAGITCTHSSNAITMTVSGGGGSSTFYRDLLNGSSLNPDTSGEVFLEPLASVTGASTAFFKQSVWSFAAPTADRYLFGSFELPAACSSGASINLAWSSNATSGTYQYAFAYRVITGDDTNTFIQTSAVETVTGSDVAPGAAHRRMNVSISPTNSNFSTAGTVQWRLARIDTSDTLADKVQVHALRFQCTP